MIKRFTISLCSFALNLVGTDANAQCNTTPCSTPVAAYDALSACILSSEHDLDCYVGETIDSWPFSLPPYWCTSVENNQWFAFTASAANVSFDIYVDNCASGGALQAALLETSDCFNFNFVSDCLGNIPSGSTQTLSNNVPLIPGNVYYLMIDGSAGAKCQFAINASGITSGPQFVCTPDASTYFYTSNQVATWSIFPAGAGTIVSANPSQSVEVEWLLPGTAQICATTTGCSANFCLDISIGQRPTLADTVIQCNGEPVICHGEVFNALGVYTFVKHENWDCSDTLVTCTVLTGQPTFTNLGQITLPCSGSFEVCGIHYSSLGFNEVTCQGSQGCDSTVTFNLLLGDVLADAGFDVSITCATAQPMLDGSASSAGAGFSYQWTTTNGHLLGGGTTLTPTVDEAGTYCLTVTNLATGCIMTDCANVTISQGLPTITFAPTTAPCDGSTVMLNVATSAGSGANYSWTTSNGEIVSGANSANPMIASPGTYCLTVTGGNGCSKSACTMVSNEISIDIVGATEFCLENNMKTFSIGTFTGAQSLQLYLQADNAAPLQVTQQGGQAYYYWTNTLTGPTTLQAWAVDSTGCKTDTAVHLVDINTATIVFDQTQTQCNYATLHAQLVGPYQPNPGLFHWSNGIFGAQTYITQNGWYSASATDNYGCHWVDSIYATVDFLGLCAHLQGTVRNNPPANCQASAANLPMAGRIVKATNASGSFFGTTDADGHYSIPVNPGTYTLSVLLPSGNGFAACANNFTVNLPFAGSMFTQDFLLYQLPDCPYMTVDVGTNLLRRCMNNSYYVYYCNDGSTTAEDAYVLLTLDQALTFLTATIPYTDLGNNAFRFEVGDLQPGQCGGFLFISFLSCSVPIGQTHCVVAKVFPDTLCTGYGPSDFTDEDCRPNIGSYDPNAKTASPPGTGTQHFVEAGTELTYQIRFQNTGTDTAFHVVLRDTLADKFDFASLEAGASSHSYTMEFFGQRVLRFTFDDIKLPPVGVNEPASIGFVQFKIRLKNDLPPQEVIENTASVYFDYNEPVATNTYFHTIGEPAVHSYLTADICQGDNYPFNGQNLTQAGEYTATFTTAVGDSIVHLTLAVYQTVETQLEAQICQGETYAFNGETLTETGDYKITLQTVQGCDSIVNLSLDAWPVYDLQPMVAICNGTTYQFNGQELGQPGTYQGQFTTTYGCDSTVTLTLELVDSFSINLSESICEGSSYFFDGQGITVPGTYTANQVSTGGCDSTVTLTLEVLPTVTFTIEALICEGQIFEYNNEILTIPGTYIYNYSASSGCDSVVTLNLNVLPTAQETIEATICAGEIFEFNGEHFSAPGTYQITLFDINGCPIIVTLILTAIPPNPETDDTLEVVQGTVINGITILADTTLVMHLADMNGCDSIVNLHLTVLPNATQNLLGQSGFEVFPNPTSGDFSVRFNLIQQSQVSLKVLDVVGRTMQSGWKNARLSTGKHSFKIAATGWPSGVYLVHFQTDTGRLAAKLVVD